MKLNNKFTPLIFSLFALLGLGACVDQLITNGPPKKDPGTIRHKRYNSPSIPQNELNDLLQMAMFNGKPYSYGEITMQGKSGERGMNPVIFSHQSHRTQYTCRVCHIELEFSMKTGESDISREDYLGGRFCGACHDGTTAFSVELACDLCHQDPNKKNKVYKSATYDSLTENMPRQKFGDTIDWVKAVETGVITPKWSLYDDQQGTSIPLPKRLEKPLQWYTKGSRSQVSFSHQAHVAWLDCANCHPDIFSIESFGTEEFNKEKILYGYYCGVCHMSVAFPINACSRCHPGKSDKLRGPLSTIF